MAWSDIKADFESRFPEITQADRDAYLDQLENVWQFYFDKGYEENKEIVLNLLAHLMFMEKSSGSGPIQAMQSKSAGSVSASFHGREQGGMMDFFGSTKYGQRYMHLIRLSGGAKFV